MNRSDNASKSSVMPDRPIPELSIRQFDGLWLVVIAFALATIPFVAGKYIEFNSNDAFDSGLNVYHAKCIVDGQKIGDTIMPSARPATLLVNVVGVGLFGYSELGPKLIQMLLQLGALVLMYFTLRKLYGPLPAMAGLVLAAFYLSCPPFAKFGNAKEQFMIVFMIIAACALIQRHMGGRWWWLILSGGAAVNIYFFKPTGVSVIIAMIVYLLMLLIARRRCWRLLGSDITGLLVGGVVGFVPLSIFYITQGQFLTLLSSFPGVRELAMVFQSGSSDSAATASGYVGASRSVSSFATQFDRVMNYYRMLIVPIGVSLLAIGVGLVDWVGLLMSRNPVDVGEREKEQQEVAPATSSLQGAVVLFFAIWWILDMLFVWISPRSYVQYYLPLMASSAMLAGVVVYRCQKKPVVLLWLIGVWLILDVVLIWVASAEHFPYLSIRSGIPKEFWLGWAIQLIPLAVAMGVHFLGRGLNRYTRIMLIILACGYALLSWSGGNVKAFQKRVGDLQKQKMMNQINVWEQVGQVIKKNSQPDDGLYVWGWMPGIYVAAQRFSPAMRPAYSDMHTDSPEVVGRQVRRLLKDFEGRAPLFIVDPQKMHYPYNTHPVFQLWPTMPGAEKKVGFVNPQLYQKNRDKFMGQVEAFTFQMLRHPDRPGGPVEEEKARKMAQAERRRHEAMEPLREFVMKHYKPVVPANSPMKLFRHQPADAQSLD